MCNSWTKIMKSGLFTFYVGPDEKEFAIHTGAILGLSDYFDSLINGEMLEARERRVHWDDIDEETFLLFSQFAYTGDYDVPCMDADPPTSTSGEAEDESLAKARVKFAAFGGPKRTVGHWADVVAEKRKKVSFDGRDEYILEPLLEKMDMAIYPTTGTISIEREISAGTLLMHAKAYVFADRYCIDSLKMMALHRLHHSLVTVRLNFYTADCVAELVRYTYANTMAHDEDVNGDQLRNLLVLFCACVYDGFLINPSFRFALRDHGEFAEGILDKLSLAMHVK